LAAVVTQIPLDSTLTLVTRAREGDRVALEIIADRYQAGLLRFAHGRVPGSARGLVDTVDIVQQALVRTLGRLDHIDASIPGSLFAYLRCSVLNQIRDEIRRAHRRPRLAELDERLPALDQDPLEVVISRHELERYDLAVFQLPADQQEAFLMRIEMDCGYREIADALGRPSAEAARMLVRRAIRAVAEALRETPAG
jgi:RNA polymerase sigma-70 factor (ECF subfamily)